MPSATQCVAVARVAAIVSAIHPESLTAEQVAEQVYGIHKLGQTLLTLYRQDDPKKPPTLRREKRILQIEERIRAQANDLALDVEFFWRGEWPMSLTVMSNWKHGQGGLGSRRGEDEPMRLGGRE